MWEGESEHRGGEPQREEGERAQTQLLAGEGETFWLGGIRWRDGMYERMNE